MTDGIVSDATEALPQGGSVAWEVPEIAGVAVLVAFFVTVVGGLAMGIDVSVGQQAPYVDQMENTWNAIQFGASWAEPLLAIILLGVVGLCWWQVEAWSDELDEDTEEGLAAFGHLRRARQISRWALGALILTATGAVADLIALIGFNIPAHGGQVAWARVIGVGAATVATVVVVVAGLVVVTRLTRPDPDTSM
jgi:uncharacterized membrane protein (DUF485 family)